MNTFQEVKAAALALSREEQETLIRDIVADQEPAGEAFGAELMAMVAARWDEIESGRVKAIPWHEAREEIAVRLGDRAVAP